MMAKKSLIDYQRKYERIIHADQSRKDILLAGLMTEMEKQFKIPTLRNEEGEREKYFRERIATLLKYFKMRIEIMMMINNKSCGQMADIR